MTEVEFYSKAQIDPAFRQQKVVETIYQRKIALSFAIVSIAGWIVYAAYFGIAEGRWPADGGVILMLVLCASLHGQARTRLGALQAIEQKEPNQPLEPTTPKRVVAHL